MLELRHLDLTLPTPEENLACDEALLDWCEEGRSPGVLRFWEPGQRFVVLGYANRVRMEVNLEACETSQIPILRRCSGGGTVLQGPGCLNYSLILQIESISASITQTNCLIMQRNRDALATLSAEPISIQGVTDLTARDLKFSGNAQRRKRYFLLFHGTILLDFDSDLMEKVLLTPARQPAYRQNRTHRDFLTRLGLTRDSIKAAFQRTWSASEPLDIIPDAAIRRLVTEKYSRMEWNFRC